MEFKEPKDEEERRKLFFSDALKAKFRSENSKEVDLESVYKDMKARKLTRGECRRELEELFR